MIVIKKRALAVDIVQSLRTCAESVWSTRESNEGKASGLEVVARLLKARMERGGTLSMQGHRKPGGGGPQPDFYSFSIAMGQ